MESSLLLTGPVLNKLFLRKLDIHIKKMLAAETLAGVDTPESIEYLLHSYAEKYPPGRVRGKKLVLIAEKSSGVLRDQAARMAAAEIRQTMDSPLYRRLCEIYQEPESAVWLERIERENRVRRAQLDANLTKAKAEGSKEVIRLALKELGSFFHETGDGTLALRAFFQGKDHALTPAQQLEMSLFVMEASLDFGRYDYAIPFAAKAEQLLPIAAAGSKPSNEALKIQVALGLCDLEKRKFKSAAKHFLSINPDIKFTSLITAEDIATYAVICALATFSRSELRDQVVNNSNFKSMLELAPLAKVLLWDFYNSKYGPAMKTLHQALPILSLDSFLCSHADTLVREIKTRAILQCVAPYSCVKLQKMAVAFDMTEKDVEAELVDLISNGQIQARIDSQNRTLLARQDDNRDVAVASALEASKKFVREGKAALLRMNLLENTVVYDPPKRKSERGAVPSMLLQSGAGEEADFDDDGQMAVE